MDALKADRIYHKDVKECQLTKAYATKKKNTACIHPIINMCAMWERDTVGGKEAEKYIMRACNIAKGGKT